MNGTIWPSKNPAWSRMPPGSEAEEKWESFESIPIILLTAEEISLLGKDPETAVRFPDSSSVIASSSKRKYMAAPDVYHKIHCLNEIRKMTFANYSPEGFAALKKHYTDFTWIHMRHCVDMLLQDLQCHADTDVVTYKWVDTQRWPQADFSINKKCRNWGEFQSWLESNRVDMKDLLTLEILSDQAFSPAEPGYYKMFGFEDSTLYPNGRGYHS
jgi:hypothetical protein